MTLQKHYKKIFILFHYLQEQSVQHLVYYQQPLKPLAPHNNSPLLYSARCVEGNPGPTEFNRKKCPFTCIQILAKMNNPPLYLIVCLARCLVAHMIFRTDTVLPCFWHSSATCDLFLTQHIYIILNCGVCIVLLKMFMTASNLTILIISSCGITADTDTQYICLFHVWRDRSCLETLAWH